jgi:hypothetical protein
VTPRAWTEAQLAVAGALRLAIGDRRGLTFFDVSLDGFWRSFRAAAICYPLYVLLLCFRVATTPPPDSGLATVLVVETIDYVALWFAFPLVVLPACRWLDRENRFLAFMVAYNWSQVPQTALLFLIGLDGATGLLTPSAAQTATLMATIAVLIYEWYIARVALAVGGSQAAFIVMLDVVLGTAMGRVAEGLY